MARQTPRKVVALSASAIAAVYVAGYVATSGADAALNAAPSPSTTGGVLAATASTSGVPALVPTPATALGATAQSAPTPPTATAAGGYRDGTYSGSGDSRRGGVTVAVTIQGGRIAAVRIADCWTEYPVSRITALPGEVVARQSARIDRVTGATYSAMAFQQAVQQALAQAGGGSSAATASSSTTSPSAQTGPGPSISVPGRRGQPPPGQPQPRQRGGHGERDGRGQRDRGYGDAG